MLIDTPPVSSAPLRVVLIDADVRVRDSLAGLIGIGEEVLVVGSAGDALEGVEIAARMRADVVVVDPKLPDVAAGIGIIDLLRARVPGVRILVMSWSDNLEGTCREHGADAFVAKSAGPNELVEAVLAVAGRS